jgi:hypothetical protein
VRVSVTVTPRRVVALREPVGAVVRGLLGQRLRDLRCLTRARSCEGCAEVARCDYARVFGVEGTNAHARRYWLQGVPEEMSWAHGARRVTLVTLGSESAVAPYLDVALRDALAVLGDPRGAPNALTVSDIERGTLGELLSPDAHGDAVRLVTRSPLDLRGDVEAAATLCPKVPGVGVLLRAGVRRIDGLLRASAVGAAPPRVEWPDLRELRVREGEMRPWRASRFSHRQGQRHPLQGIHGALVLDGAREVVSLLRALAVVGVGRHTSHGLGEMTVEVVS